MIEWSLSKAKAKRRTLHESNLMQKKIFSGSGGTSFSVDPFSVALIIYLILLEDESKLESKH